MTNLTTSFSLLFLLGSLALFAQENPYHRVADTRIYLDADVGALLLPDCSATILSHAAVGAGYRIDDLHAVGLEYRRAASDGTYYDEAGGGLGAVYRLTWKGLYAKFAGGIVLHSQKDSSNP